MRGAAAAAAFASCCAIPAYADSSGSIDLAIYSSTFSSPSDAYGPWLAEDVNVRFGPDGSTGIEFINRHASDRFNPNTEQFYQLDNYHTWSKRFTTYASASYGSGAPYFQDRFTVEGDAGIAKGLVLIAGGGIGQQYVLGSAQQVALGTDYYFGDNYLSLRYRPAWSRVLGNTQGYSAALSLGHDGLSTHTIRVGAGGENDASVINIVNPTIVDERTFDVGYSYKHWLDAKRGFHIDLDQGSLDRRNGGEIYHHTDVGVGYFFATR